MTFSESCEYCIAASLIRRFLWQFLLGLRRPGDAAKTIFLALVEILHVANGPNFDFRLLFVLDARVSGIDHDDISIGGLHLRDVDIVRTGSLHLGCRCWNFLVMSDNASFQR